MDRKVKSPVQWGMPVIQPQEAEAGERGGGCTPDGKALCKPSYIPAQQKALNDIVSLSNRKSTATYSYFNLAAFQVTFIFLFSTLKLE